ncbi:hypothetical protein QVD17_13989 [Tagetes erecta]|uniref:Uncharacterized protein n=1 Tax=Tagetes erecta TaxID=13708 RepID=A0AAD8KWF0_TARER|nr:hypothetical protein QVD17_13989 [Tagetes erecta]
MASACLNTIGLSPESLPECSLNYSSYSWLSSRINTEMPDEEDVFSPSKNVSDLPQVSDPVKELSDLPVDTDTNEFDGFEFTSAASVMMLPADELFSDGKLVPLQFSIRQDVNTSTTTTTKTTVESPDTTSYCRDVYAVDPYLYSPRAPRCSSGWRELLGFKKVNQYNNQNAKVADNKRTSLSLSSSQNGDGSTKSIRQLLYGYRSSKSSNDPPFNLPLLKDPDNESVSISSRLSLSSSSSGHDIDDLPRLSLDFEKLNSKRTPNPSLNLNNRPKTRMSKTKVKTTTKTQSTDSKPRVGQSTNPRALDATFTGNGNRGLSMDSPRMNSSGKIVFHSLERSSSSPSSLIGGPRLKHQGMERSYSGNVRITPVLNVPVCSLRGSSKSGGVFGFPMFSSQKRESCSSSNNGVSNRSQRFNGKS